VGFGGRVVGCVAKEESASEKTNTVGIPQTRRSEADGRKATAAAGPCHGSMVCFPAQQRDVLSMVHTADWGV